MENIGFDKAAEELQIDAKPQKDMEKEILVRFSKRGEFPALTEIWKACFKDTEENTVRIFEKLQKPENILVLPCGGEIAAMLSFREFELTSPENQCKAAYIYGVATHPAYQGKGYSTVLLGNAAKLLTHRGYACAVLVPAEESLFGFYQKRGFETAFKLNKATVEVCEIKDGESFEFKEIDVKTFGFTRDEHFGDSKMFACWDDEYLEYIAMESKLSGGGALGFERDGKRVCAMCYVDGDTVLVKELAAAPSELEAAIRSLKSHFGGAKRFLFYLREDVKTSYTNNLLPFAMIQWYDNKVRTDMEASGGSSAYIAHVLD